VPTVSRPLTPDEREIAEAFASAGGPVDAYLLDQLDLGTEGFWGAWDGGALVGVSMFRRGAICAASATTPRAARSLAVAMTARSPWGSIVGPDPPCGDVADALRGRERFRVDRRQDFMYVRRGAALGPCDARLRPATRADLEELVPLVHAYRVEDGLSRPGDPFTAGIREHTEERVAAGHVFVVEHAGALVFTGAFNFHGPRGTGLGGIYTPPAFRGHGLAARATAEMCRIAFAESPVVTLHVNPRNVAAIKAYEHAGLRTSGSFRLTFR
jgi:RimJ/RimL family protein N-acetyltransferase